MKGRTFSGEAELSKSTYFSQIYFSELSMHALVEQVLTVEKLKPKKVLEIGKGNGFVSDFLRNSGIDVITFDLNKNLEPDIVGNITEVASYFKSNEFDLILCAEVLEHIPFEHFEQILKQFQQITSKHVVLTIPVNQQPLLDVKFSLKLPKLKELRNQIFISIPGFRKVIEEGHHWEINSQKETKTKQITSCIKNHFDIGKTYRSKSVNWHRYFILDKRTNVSA